MAKKSERPLAPGQAAFRTARLRGVPLVALETADPGACIQKSIDSLNGRHAATPLLMWDCVRGAKPINTLGEQVLSAFNDDNLSDLVSMLAAFAAKADKLQVPMESDPDRKVGAVLFLNHANRFLSETGVMQAVWNCRDAFEPAGCMLALLGPSLTLPPELKNDVIVITEPLPSRDELSDILDRVADDCGFKPEQIAERETLVDTVTGVSAFGARQSIAMSFRKDGVDPAALWENKRKLIEATRGLKVWKGGETFAEIKGLTRLQRYMSSILTSGTTPVRCILFADEIEKQLAGVAGDSSGTAQDSFYQLLAFLEDYAVACLVLIGPGGTGKSAIAKACGQVARAPVISFDLGAMRDRWVGSSEGAIREALQVALAVSDQKLIMIMTCNAMAALPPELKRRATLGTYFVDLPSPEAQADIWQVWIKKFGLDGRQTIPPCEGWSGAEIKACCGIAHRTGWSLVEAAGEIVPIIQSDPDKVLQLRQWANGRINSASKAGKYQFTQFAETKATATGRKIEV